MSYKLSFEAKDDLKRIYRRGVVEFGEVRADDYFNALMMQFDRVSENPHLFPVADDIEKSIRKCVCGVDVIFYELTDYGVLIVRILGRQDRYAQIK